MKVDLPRPTPNTLLECVFQGFDVLEKRLNEELPDETAVLAAEIDALQAIEPWTLVSGVGGPSFLNGWGNHASNATQAGFRKNPMAQVELRGLLANAGSSPNGNATIAFQLPAGYRPSTARWLTCSAFDSGLSRHVAMAKIDTNGDVTLTVGNLVGFAAINSFFLEGVVSTA